MELVTKKRLVLVAGRGHEELSNEVAEHLGVPLGEVVLSTFANGEIYCRFGENIRGADVFVFQSHCEPTNDRLMEQLIMIDAAKRASAKRITAVVPFYGYARQDRKAEGREPISARLVADLITAAGAHRVLTVDLHTGQIQGFFDYPVDHLTAVPVLEEYLRHALDGEPVFVAPDAGGGKLARRYADRFGGDIAFIDKRRPKGTHNVAVATEVVGEIDGRTCVIVDDMIDTAGTVVSAANLLIDRGASRDLHRGHPRPALRPGRRPAEERTDPRGRRHQHGADPVGEALRQPPGALDRTPGGQHDRRGVRGTLGERAVRRRQRLGRKLPRLSFPARRFEFAMPDATLSAKPRPKLGTPPGRPAAPRGPRARRRLRVGHRHAVGHGPGARAPAHPQRRIRRQHGDHAPDRRRRWRPARTRPADPAPPGEGHRAARRLRAHPRRREGHRRSAAAPRGRSRRREERRTARAEPVRDLGRGAARRPAARDHLRRVRARHGRPDPRQRSRRCPRRSRSRSTPTSSSRRSCSPRGMDLGEEAEAAEGEGGRRRRGRSGPPPVPRSPAATRADAWPPTCWWSASATRARITRRRATTSARKSSRSSRSVTTAGCARARSARSSPRCASTAAASRSRSRSRT